MLTLLAATVVGLTPLFAQTTLVATLTKDGTLAEYYGANALGSAYADAKDGDVITLSKGTFAAVNIEKAITVRGSGMFGGTQIQGNFTINIPKKSIIQIEGISIDNNVAVYGSAFTDTSDKIVFLKDYISNLSIGGSETKLINCFVNSCGGAGGNSSFLYIQNSALQMRSSLTPNSVWEVLNSYVYNAQFINYSPSVLNSFLVKGRTEVFDSKVHIENCEICERNTNCSYFTSYSWYVDYERNLFVLNDEYKDLVGSDGTEVGIYGGAFPFDPTPSNPQVKDFTVETDTKEGKLSVKVNIE